MLPYRSAQPRIFQGGLDVLEWEHLGKNLIHNIPKKSPTE